MRRKCNSERFTPSNKGLKVMYNLSRTSGYRVYSLRTNKTTTRKRRITMAAPKDTGDTRLALDPDVDFAGYDPYIVALTGGAPAEVTSDTPSTSARSTTESRKVALMAWLREHAA